MSQSLLPLAVSLGDPSGIGPEVVAKCWDNRHALGLPPFVAVGDPRSLSEVWDGPISVVTDPRQVEGAFEEGLPLLAVVAAEASVAGQPSTAGAHCSLDSLELAVGLARSGSCSGVVTGPVSKHQLYAIGFAHPGQTEFVAERCGVSPGNVAMMLAGPSLRTVPVTTHLPLRDVADRLSAALIEARGRVTLRGLQRNFGIAEPTLAVAGFNPHAGEGGALGREEIEIIMPAIEALRAEGWHVVGPMPADTMFHTSARARYDAALCMYHDQALIPLKALHFEEGVNITLGLPIVRTAPDHGTAFDIAGEDRADPRAMAAAIRMAAQSAADARGAGVTELPPLREVIARHGLSASKALGQNFLLDRQLLSRIAAIPGDLSGAAAYEVGPGPGGLTGALLDAGAAVTAVERDRRCIPALEELGALFPGKLHLLEDDALKVDEMALVGRGAHVISNLPYNVGTALLLRWLGADWTPWWSSLTLMFQKEVAERIVAAPGEGAYGRLAVAAQWRASPRIALQVHRSAFVPPPKVASAVVHIVPAEEPEGVKLAVLERLTAAAFGQRRKMLRQSLKGVPDALDALSALGIAAERRAETVSVPEWVALAKSLSSSSG